MDPRYRQELTGWLVLMKEFTDIIYEPLCLFQLGKGRCYDIDFDIIGSGNPVTPAVGQRAAVELVLLNLQFGFLRAPLLKHFGHL